MRNVFKIEIAVAVVAALAMAIATGHVMGCTSTEVVAASPQDSSETTKPSESATAEFEKAKTEMNEATQAIQDYAYAKKGEFVSNMEKDLVEIQFEIDRMSLKVDSTGGAAKADAEAKLDAVREKWAQAKKQLDRAEIATESNWNDNIDGFNQSYGELTNSFNTMRQWLSDKIEP